MRYAVPACGIICSIWEDLSNSVPQPILEIDFFRRCGLFNYQHVRSNIQFHSHPSFESWRLSDIIRDYYPAPLVHHCLLSHSHFISHETKRRVKLSIMFQSTILEATSWPIHRNNLFQIGGGDSCLPVLFQIARTLPMLFIRFSAFQFL